ncbi:hypothetical protein J8J14_23515 [Roseomonas sp. SSH11]|uniref:Uncharacterized protein n=1 Tax=Pararoseomonas baculiformis TaxID=2820812 RepID=A0ABS4ALG2_9PROT|nr:hypothetical protein [Pararoseomonas baculiformis]MBP0447724.1 hypothetical protein [Pararoseomonas baculiformis]
MPESARIYRWAIVECCEPGKEPTQHVMGWINEHSTFTTAMDDLYKNDPYLGSPLASIDLEKRQAVNRRGRVIELLGPPAEGGTEIPATLQAMQQRAHHAWRLPEGTTWRRIA